MYFLPRFIVILWCIFHHFISFYAFRRVFLVFSGNKEVSGQAKAEKTINNAFRKISSKNSCAQHCLAVLADTSRVGTRNLSHMKKSRTTWAYCIPWHCLCCYDTARVGPSSNCEFLAFCNSFQTFGVPKLSIEVLKNFL